MRSVLTKVFWPLLKRFETGEESPNYKKSHRVTLNIVGTLFVVLSLGSAGAAYYIGEPAALIPVLVFFLVGFVAVVVGALGSSSAVTKIWGQNKK